MTEALITAFADEYHDYNNISPRRRVDQVGQLRRLGAFLQTREASYETITSDLFGEYLRSLMDAGLAAATIEKQMKMIRPFFKWLWLRETITADTYMRLREVPAPRVPTPLPRPYKRKEIAKLRVELAEQFPFSRRQNDRPYADYMLARYARGTASFRSSQALLWRLQMEAIVALALCGGLRRAEIFNLNLEDMHPDNEYLLVYGAAKNTSATSKPRGVPWMGNAQQAVGEWLEAREVLKCEHDFPWLSLWQTRPTHPLSWQRFEGLLTNLGSGWEYHRLRHTFATEALRAHMELQTVSKILGHARLQQTLAYAELASADVVSAARRVDRAFTSHVNPEVAA